MPKETKGWSKARRAKQAENIRKNKPWEHSTGPKTTDGKATTAQNATKSGLHRTDIKQLKKALIQHRKLLKLWD